MVFIFFAMMEGTISYLVRKAETLFLENIVMVALPWMSTLKSPKKKTEQQSHQLFSFRHHKAKSQIEPDFSMPSNFPTTKAKKTQRK